jgi:hypothetical protein
MYRWRAGGAGLGDTQMLPLRLMPPQTIDPPAKCTPHENTYKMHLGKTRALEQPNPWTVYTAVPGVNPSTQVKARPRTLTLIPGRLYVNDINSRVSYTRIRIDTKESQLTRINSGGLRTTRNAHCVCQQWLFSHQNCRLNGLDDQRASISSRVFVTPSLIRDKVLAPRSIAPRLASS